MRKLIMICGGYLLSEDLDGLAEHIWCPICDALNTFPRSIDLHVIRRILADEPEHARACLRVADLVDTPGKASDDGEWRRHGVAVHRCVLLLL